MGLQHVELLVDRNVKVDGVLVDRLPVQVTSNISVQAVGTKQLVSQVNVMTAYFIF